MQSKSGFAEINETKIYYEIMGEGHPLVLIHGGLMDCRMWDNVFSTLAEDYKVLRYDIRGYGRSAVPKEPFSHIEDLFHLLNFLNIDKTHILGLSLGGGIAIDFTIAYPDMIDSLIPVSSALNGYYDADTAKSVSEMSEIIKIAEEKGIEKATELVMKLKSFALVEFDAAVEQKMSMMVKENFENWSKRSNIANWLSPPAIQRLFEIKAPVLVIVADHDTETILNIANMLIKKIPTSKKETIHDAGHHLNMDKPNEFNRIVTDFLNNL